MDKVLNILLNIAPYRTLVEVPFDGAVGFKKFLPGQYTYLNDCYVQRIRQVTTAGTLGLASMAGTTRLQELPAAGYLQVQSDNQFIINNYPVTGNDVQFTQLYFTPTLPFRIDVYNSGINVVDATNTTANGCYLFEIDYWPAEMTAAIDALVGNNLCKLAPHILTGQLQTPYFRLEVLPIENVLQREQNFGQNDFYQDKYVADIQPFFDTVSGPLTALPNGNVTPYAVPSGSINFNKSRGNEIIYANYPIYAGAQDGFTSTPWNRLRMPVRINWQASRFFLYDNTAIPAPPAVPGFALGVWWWPQALNAVLDAQMKQITCA